MGISHSVPRRLDYARIGGDFEGAAGRRCREAQLRPTLDLCHRNMHWQPSLGLGARQLCACASGSNVHRHGAPSSRRRRVNRPRNCGPASDITHSSGESGTISKFALRRSGLPIRGRPKSGPRNRDMPTDGRAIARLRFLDPPSAIPPCAQVRNAAPNSSIRSQCTPGLYSADPSCRRITKPVAVAGRMSFPAGIRYSLRAGRSPVVPSPSTPRPCVPAPLPSTSSPPPQRSAARRRS